MRWILLVVLLAIAGCATEAQRELRRMNDQMAHAVAVLKPCFDKALQSPAAIALKDKLPPWDLREPIPLTTLADSTKPAPEQVQHLFDYYAGLQPCRKQAMEHMAAIHPGLVAILAEAYAGQDERAVQLAKRTVTWGDSARAANQARQATMAQLHALDQQITQNLANAHAYEVQRRQQAGQALLMWGMYQQQLYQQQQMINAVNRPVMTNCRYIGQQISCTSY